MSETKKLVPKRRFKEFKNAGEWEQRKLGENAKFLKGQGYSKKDLVEKGEPIILYGRLYTNYETIIREVDTYVEAKLDSIISNGTEVIVPASGETAEDIARASAVYNSGIILGGDLNIIYPEKNINSVFLALSISNGYPQKELSTKAQGKSVVHLRNTDLKNLKINFACIDEQKKVSKYFEELDNLITLHQRKLEKIKAMKTAYLYEMFPAEGESKPKRRFNGFTDDWEQRKLGEMSLSFEYGLNVASKEYDGTNKYIRITDINDSSRDFSVNDLTSPNIDLSNAENYKLQYGDILFARTGASVGKTYIYKISDGIVYYAGFLIRARIKKDYDPNFVFYSTLTNKYNEYIRVTSQRSGQPGVNAQEYSEFKIKVPEFEEQVKIGVFLRELDNLITLHQQKLDKLKNLKKAYLNEMFI
jgi:type I restriction enzyme S subunit